MTMSGQVGSSTSMRAIHVGFYFTFYFLCFTFFYNDDSTGSSNYNPAPAAAPMTVVAAATMVAVGAPATMAVAAKQQLQRLWWQQQRRWQWEHQRRWQW